MASPGTEHARLEAVIMRAECYQHIYQFADGAEAEQESRLNHNAFLFNKTNDQNECVRRVGALRGEVVELNECAVVFD